MQHTKTFFALFAVLCLPLVTSAQYFVTGGIAYGVLSETEHTVEVTTKYNGYYRGNITIPPTVTYGGITYDVVSLGELAFYGSTLTSVTIPTSVTRIKSQCFLYSTGPTSVAVPASVADIGMMAFAATNMSAINVDEANPYYRSIDGILFSKDTSTIVECPVARSGLITLPQNTMRIASWAFANCQSISGIILHEGLTDIGYGAFMTATSLDNVVIPASVTHIGENLFSGCTALNNLVIAEGNSHYYLDGLMLYTIGGDTLLSAHKSADTLLFPATLKAVGGFSNNRNIRYVSLSDSTTTILENAFEVSTLASIDMPGRMELIDEYAFYGCESLTRVGMPVSVGTMGNGCFSYCTRLTSVDIPCGLSIIPKESFYGSSSLSHITWGDSVSVIDSFAFGGCAFEELVLPSTLRVLRDGAFNGYYDGTIRRVVFSAPVDTLETEAFYGQPLTTVVLKNSVPPIVTTYEGMYGPLDDADVDSIFIPCGRLSAYLADSYWGQFADKYYEDCNDIDAAAEDEILLYPNPATDYLTIVGNGCYYFEIVNMLGEPVVSCEISGSANNIDVSHLARGAYFLRLHTNGGIATKRVILW